MTHLWQFPVIRALAALGVAFVLGLCIRAIPGLGRLYDAAWLAGIGLMACMIGAWWDLRTPWRLFLLLTPWVVAWQLGDAPSVWVYPAMLAGLLLVFGGGLLTRVPLYNSNRVAWETLATVLEHEGGAFVDLGAGLGGPLAHLARRYPQRSFHGVEASPLVWLVARIRTARLPNCSVHFGSLWRTDLSACTVVYAFLSPAPMARLWEKVCAELPPGALFISHTFEIPGAQPFCVLPLPGRPGACLRLYRR